jgi:pilus assembly protein Flp/PilA
LEWLVVLVETRILNTLLETVFRIQNIYSKGIYIMLFALKEKGQGLVEYAIILALIAIVVIAVMTTLGKKVNNTFNTISASLTV